MANLNKVMLIGRLTRDPEIKTFSNGGKVANVGFAVNNRRKNQQSGQWEEVPVWVDLKAFNRDTGRKLADLIEKYLRKGSQAYVEGHLVLEEWNAKEGGEKRSKMVVYIDEIEFLGARGDVPAGDAEQEEQPAPKRAPKKAAAETGGGDGMDEVPF
ncbi:MAG TPA: single-stranded DNA-binding protein [Elusimicrobiales bacterium]|nr:single-stranded DNA-binding protein [Elusimicrobiales bacterium]